jgi:hypothetical protein
MKTSPFARGIVKARVYVLCLVMLGTAATAYQVSGALAARISQNLPQSTAPHAPNIDLGALMESLR